MLKLLKRAKDMVGVEGTEGRNPFEQFMLAWSILTGAALAFGSPAPGSVQELLPQWMVTAWYILLCTGGLVGLAGVWLGNLILSLLVERAAMLVVGPATTLYAIAVLSQVGRTPRALPVAGLLLFYALAAFWRGYRIQSYLHRLRSTLARAAEK